ncbi:hypothetical protein E2C01_041751 [Portunus trituberculatus]|uniref:Uncharacterized protein n=1 Tax=Portunus trituberculatus TaxID=210409 RepID=A0A5B7FRU8_PORTR|nr:hypothetical protein [Portunus trituberculatus]
MMMVVMVVVEVEIHCPHHRLTLVVVVVVEVVNRECEQRIVRETMKQCRLLTLDSVDSECVCVCVWEADCYLEITRTTTLLDTPSYILLHLRYPSPPPPPPPPPPPGLAPVAQISLRGAFSNPEQLSVVVSACIIPR